MTLEESDLVDMNKLCPLIFRNTTTRLETPDLNPVLDEYFGCRTNWKGRWRDED